MRPKSVYDLGHDPSKYGDFPCPRLSWQKKGGGMELLICCKENPFHRWYFHDVGKSPQLLPEAIFYS